MALPTSLQDKINANIKKKQLLGGSELLGNPNQVQQPVAQQPIVQQPIASTDNAGIVERLTDAEALTGTDTTKYPSINQVSKYWGISIVAGTAFTLAEANATGSSTSNTYTKDKQITIGGYGTYTVSFDIKSGNGDEAYGRIYKNGVAFGTEQSTTSTSYVTKSEDLTFDKGDTCELWIKINSVVTNVFVENMNIKYDFGFVSDTVVDIN